MGRTDHNAAIKAAVNGLVGNTRRRDDVKHIGVSARGDKSRDDSSFEHIARTARILTNNDTPLLFLTRTVIPANDSADFEGMLDVEAIIGFAAEAIGSEVLHGNPLKREQKQTHKALKL